MTAASNYHHAIHSVTSLHHPYTHTPTHPHTSSTHLTYTLIYCRQLCFTFIDYHGIYTHIRTHTHTQIYTYNHFGRIVWISCLNIAGQRDNLWLYSYSLFLPAQTTINKRHIKERKIRFPFLKDDFYNWQYVHINWLHTFL